MMDWQEVISSLAEWGLSAGIKIGISLLILIVGFRFITLTTRRIERNLIDGKRRLDKTLVNTLFYLTRIVLKSLLSLCIVGYLGVDTSGIAALITSLGVGVGLAVNGALSNLAGGALILITRPFRIDDFIEAQGYSGTVEDIHIVATRLRTPDNKVVYIPNGTLSAGNIVNYSEKNIRRVDISVCLSYSTDFALAERYLVEAMSSHEKVLASPEPTARISEYGENGVCIASRCWCNTGEYWDVRFDLLEKIKSALDNHGIKIPYNQLDVNVKNK